MVCEAPNYPSNYGIPEGLGMEYSLCHMKFEDDYRLDMDAIKSMVTDKTKVRRGNRLGRAPPLCCSRGLCAVRLLIRLYYAGAVDLPPEQPDRMHTHRARAARDRKLLQREGYLSAL